ncbi:MAG: RNA 2',3'-cyclic phosphodiesterase [Candidatus Kaelpia aquatica]|nr:RNA 2',3'-cyclic phosphodiesterase [Candidatus Kaelpia aquatica]
MSALRTFIAIEIDDKTRTIISNIQNSFKKSKADIRLIAPDNIHITLIFIGNIEATKVDEIRKELQNLISSTKVFKILPKDIGCFPNTKNPKILWIGIKDGAEKLIELNKKIKLLLDGCKITTDDRDFHPHITIGRVKSSNNIDALKATLLNFSEQSFQQIAVERISLIKSNLTPAGPQYKTITRWELSKNK